LTTRPVILHLAKSKLEGNDADLSSAASSALQILATTCIEAAGMSLDVLHSLKQQELLAKFGYFDLDAAVSAAFVFVLVESLQSTGSPRSGLHGIRGATGILQYLIKHGNKAAAKRMSDVEHICQHLGIEIGIPTVVTSPAAAEGPSDSTYNRALHDPVSSAEDTTASDGPHAVDTYEESALDTDWRQALFELPDHSSHLPNSLESNNESYGIPPIDDISGFNLDFGNDFILTGADEIDWEEFERQITRNQ
jgi:proline utilization trans-activator